MCSIQYCSVAAICVAGACENHSHCNAKSQPKRYDSPKRPQSAQGSYARSPAKSRPAVSRGRGLGLAIIERIARAHGGGLELVNRAGGVLIARVMLRMEL